MNCFSCLFIPGHHKDVLARLRVESLPICAISFDDSQLYLSFRPADGLLSQTSAIEAMERCIEDIRHWMVSDRLLLNDEKTEFLLIGTRQQLSKVEPLRIPLRVEAMDIEPVNCVRNLGAWFDSILSMETHINKVWSSWIYTRLSSNSYPCVCHKSAGLLQYSHVWPPAV